MLVHTIEEVREQIKKWKRGFDSRTCSDNGCFARGAQKPYCQIG